MSGYTKEALGTHWTRHWAGPRTGFQVVEKTVLASVGNQSSVIEPKVMCFIDIAT